MSSNDLKAELSHAYVRAVAHAAGYFVQEGNRAFDSDGVDLTVLERGNRGVVRSPRLDSPILSLPPRRPPSHHGSHPRGRSS